MAQVGKLKFKDQDLYMHYTEFKNEFWLVMDSDEEKTEFFRTYDDFSFLFDLKADEYTKVTLEINEDKEFTQELFEKMLNEGNSYFKEFKDSFVSVKLIK